MTTLYQLADEYKFLCDYVGDPECSDEDFGKALAQLRDELEGKAENIGKLILSMQTSIGAISTEENRLASRRRVLENKIAHLKGYLLQELTAAGIDKVERDVVTVSLRKAPPSCVVINQDEIPYEFRRTIPETWEPDKKAIIEQFKQTGLIVPGIQIVADKKTLQVR
jgi:hypothetical protein